MKGFSCLKLLEASRGQDAVALLQDGLTVGNEHGLSSLHPRDDTAHATDQPELLQRPSDHLRLPNHEGPAHLGATGDRERARVVGDIPRQPEWGLRLRRRRHQ